MKHKKKSKHLWSLMLILTMAMAMMIGMTVTAWAQQNEDAHTHTIGEGAAAQTITFQPWTSTTSLPDAEGSYYLADNVQLNNTWNVPANSTVNLCLNGNNINSNTISTVINIPNGATLNLYDDAGKEGRIIALPITNNCVITVGSYGSDKAVFNLMGGTISGGKGKGGIYVNSNGFFTMEGGVISGNTGSSGSGGVTVATNATFTMKGGSITDNIFNSYGYAGGVYVSNKGTFNMEGGSITNNICSINQSITAGGVSVAGGGTFNMKGGAVTGNKSCSNNGGIYIGNYDGSVGTFNVSGEPIIKDNLGRCVIDSGFKYSDGTGVPANVCLNNNNVTVSSELKNTDPIGVSIASIAGGVFTQSKDGAKASEYKKNFVPDKDDFVIKEDGDELKLAHENTVSYLGADGTTKETGDIYALMSSIDLSSNSTAPAGWYVVDKDCELNNYMNINDTVNLILCDGVTLTAKKGLNLYNSSKAGKLNIFSQSTGKNEGELVATGEENIPGIGARYSSPCGSVNIYGGNIKVTGGKNAAAIGGGYYTSYDGTKTPLYGGIVRIYGGTLEAAAGDDAVAIGGGAGSDDHGIVVLGKNIKVLAGDDEKSAADVTSSFVDNHDQKWVKTITRKPVSATVTFKVANGSWNEGEGEAATADKTVELKGYEGDTLKLAADQIPEAGSKPAEGYKAGSWDTVPSAKTSITKDTTYTYTYAQRDAADELKDLIATIPDDPTTPEGKDAVKEARQSYDKLTDDQKDEIKASELRKLINAEKAIEVADVSDMIKALPDEPTGLTEADETKAQAAYGAYMALTEAQKALLDAEVQQKVGAYKAYYEAPYAVSAMVTKLPYDPAKATGDDAKKAYDAYMALTDAQKALLGEAAQQKVEAYGEFFAPAYELIGMVKALPDDPADLTAADETAAQAAYGLYFTLSDAQKALLGEDVQQKVAAYGEFYTTKYENQKAANNVSALVKALPDDPAKADATAAQAAYGAYMALTDDQKALLKTDVQNKVKAYADYYKTRYANQKAAANVSDMVNNLPYYPAQADAKDAQAAFGAYMALTNAQKALLSKEVQQKVAAYKNFYEVKYAKDQKMKLKSVKARKGKKAVVKWNAVSGVSGYQIYYKAKGKKGKKVNVSSAKAVKKTVKKLKAGKKYTFKVRTFTKVYNPETGKDQMVYGKWSNKKKIRARR